MRCVRFRASLATTGVIPTVWLSTTTVAPAGWLLTPTCWELPCMIVAHAATRADAKTRPTTFVLRDIIPPRRRGMDGGTAVASIRRAHRQVVENGHRIAASQRF